MPARHPLPETPVQVVTVTATGGTFTLTYSGQQTGPLPFDLTADVLRGALEGLSRIGAGNVDVSGAGRRPVRAALRRRARGPQHRGRRAG